MGLTLATDVPSRPVDRVRMTPNRQQQQYIAGCAVSPKAGGSGGGTSVGRRLRLTDIGVFGVSGASSISGGSVTLKAAWRTQTELAVSDL